MVPPQIESYRFGQIVVDGQTYTKDIILLPSGLVPGWRRRHGHELSPEDLAAVFDKELDLLVVGCGAYGRMRVLPQTMQSCRERGIELRALNTSEACDLYNAKREGEQTAAALHLTC
ncbi:MAG: MTH938/NDUFAF3 family protein [Anaerolineales bacterium]|jgi:hypothetical protein